MGGQGFAVNSKEPTIRDCRKEPNGRFTQHDKIPED